MEDEARKASAFELVLGVWTRQKWLGIMVFAAPFSAAVPLVTALPNVYQATATVVVERQQVPEEFVKSTVTTGLAMRLQAISEDVLSRARLESLITRLGLYSDLRSELPLEDLIVRTRQSIKLDLKESEHSGSRRPGEETIAAFSISYRGRDQEAVGQVANALASFYVEENLKVRERQATGTADFLKARLEETKTRLDDQERKVSEFKQRYIGELPEQLQANLATLERLNTQLQNNAENEIRAQERRDGLVKQLAEIDRSVGGEGTDGAPSQMAELRQELTALRTRFSDKYPDVIRVKAQIAALERERTETESNGMPDRESGTQADPAVARLKEALNEAEAEIKALKANTGHLQAALTAYQTRVENTPKREQELQELSRDYETIKTLYDSLLKRHEEAQLAESLEQRQKAERFRIIDPARASGAPVAPKRFRLLLLSLVASLGLAAGAAVLAEQLDTSFHTLADLRATTTVPILASIPRIVTPTDVGRRRQRFWLAVSVAIVGLNLIVGASYLVARGNEQLLAMFASG